MKRLGLALCFGAVLAGAASHPEAAPRRASITFILGEDADPALPLYRLAQEHFQFDPVERTDDVVPQLRSLQEVRNFLADHPPQDRRPWGVINLVVHGSSTGFMEVPLIPGDPPVTPQRLCASFPGAFPPLPDQIVDADTELRIHGCSLGRNPGVLKALSRALGGEDGQRPLVRATPWFTCFRTREPGTPRTTRFLCENWDVVYRPGTTPDPSTLRARLKGSPAPPFNLEEALGRSTSGPQGAPFSYVSPRTFTWTVVYPGSEPPPVTGPRFLRRWLQSQVEFMRKLHAAGGTFDQYLWKAEPVRHALGGEWFPALRVTGTACNLHLLRPLPNRPRPHDAPEAWTDAGLYTSVR